MVVLPVKYLDEVKWLPEQRMSFWRHIDRVRAPDILSIRDRLQIDINVCQAIHPNPDRGSGYH